MLPYRDGKITKVALGIFFLLVLAYAYFEAQGILFGPSITIDPTTTDVHDPLVTIAGQADRIASLLMNGAPIEVTQNGEFSEPYLLSPGDNRIVLDATDRYGHSRSRVIEIVYTPAATTSATSTLAVATSTSAASTATASSAPASSTPSVAQ